jgi:hypothetical protein
VTLIDFLLLTGCDRLETYTPKGIQFLVRRFSTNIRSQRVAGYSLSGIRTMQFRIE